MPTLAESIAERMRQRAQERASAEKEHAGLGARLRAETPLRLSWRLSSPGLIDPISETEAKRCGMNISKLKRICLERVHARSVAEDEAAREAWLSVLAPKRSAGKLSLPIPVKWQGDPEPEDDIPF